MCAEHTPPRAGGASRAAAAARGLSLIELLVGIVIALLVSITATSGSSR